MQIDVLTKFILPASLILIMFGMGLSLKIADFIAVMKFPKAVTVGLLGQMLLLPAVAFIIAIIFALPPELAVGMMIISLAPGGATSNMFSYLFKGDVALSITLTAMVGLVAPFTIPFVVAISMEYFSNGGTTIEMPILKTIIQLLIITVIPVIIGMLFLAFLPRIANKIEKVLKWLSLCILFLIIGLIGYQNWDSMGQFYADVGLPTLILNIIVLTLGFHLAKWTALTQKQAITIGFEVGIQNGTLAMVVAGSIIGNSTMMIPAITYSLFMFVTGGIFGWVVTRRLEQVEIANISTS